MSAATIEALGRLRDEVAALAERARLTVRLGESGAPLGPRLNDMWCQLERICLAIITERERLRGEAAASDAESARLRYLQQLCRAAMPWPEMRLCTPTGIHWNTSPDDTETLFRELLRIEGSEGIMRRILQCRDGGR